MRESAATLLCAASLVLAGKLGQVVQPQLKAPVGMTLHQQEALEESAVASVFGEFRASLADFLWLEADRYLHFGVGTRGRLDSEKNDAKVGKVQGVAAHDAHHDETTIVPSAASDWRGLLGYIERETQPYMDMSHHQERDAKEALPLFRLMTWSNPRFVQGYVQGAMQMASRPEKRQEALDFLREGERNNPESISIQVTLCEFYYRNLKQLEAAEPYGRKAVELFVARDRSTLSQDEQEDANSAFRWLVGLYRDLGDIQSKQGNLKKAKALYERACQIATECLRHYPEDPTAIHFLRAYRGE